MVGSSFRRRISLVTVFGLLLVGITLVSVEARRDRPNVIIEVVAEDQFYFRAGLRIKRRIIPPEN